MIMPFGKHKGKRLDEVPPNYLLWALDNMDRLSPTLRSAMEDVLEVRAHPPVDTVSAVCGAIKTWYRHASRKYHPDHGGSNEKQIVVNDCYESLVESIKSLNE